jgi:hypothetical protein
VAFASRRLALLPSRARRLHEHCLHCSSRETCSQLFMMAKSFAQNRSQSARGCRTNTAIWNGPMAQRPMSDQTSDQALKVEQLRPSTSQTIVKAERDPISFTRSLAQATSENARQGAARNRAGLSSFPFSSLPLFPPSRAQFSKTFLSLVCVPRTWSSTTCLFLSRTQMDG